jgi:hypothetical protein
MEKSNLSSNEIKTEIVVGIVLAALVAFVFMAQTGASVSSSSLISSLFFY